MRPDRLTLCLLVVAFRILPGTPLLIGANRDEFLNRPADSMAVLHPAGPRRLGGRDHQAGAPGWRSMSTGSSPA